MLRNGRPSLPSWMHAATSLPTWSVFLKNRNCPRKSGDRCVERSYRIRGMQKPVLHHHPAAEPFPAQQKPGKAVTQRMRQISGQRGGGARAIAEFFVQEIRIGSQTLPAVVPFR